MTTIRSYEIPLMDSSLMLKTLSMFQHKKEISTVSTDGHTGLFDRGFFMISLEREVSRSRRNGHPFTLAMINVDSFDISNQEQGFLRGAQKIKDVATIIVTTIRGDVDLAAYFGGDVISLILPATDTQSATVLAERIRSRIVTETQTALTVSIGLATYPSDAIKSETLLERAQEALTKVKLHEKTYKKESVNIVHSVP